MAMTQQGDPHPSGERPRGLRLSTRSLRDAQRVELWSQYNETHLIGADVRTVGASLLADAVTMHLPTTRLAFVSAVPHMIERSVDRIRRSGTDMVAMYFSLAGEAYFYFRGGMVKQRPGELIVCDASRPFARLFVGEQRELALFVPRARFLQLTALGDVPEARRWRFGGEDVSPEARGMADAVRNGLRGDWSMGTAQDLEAHLGRLLAELFEGDEQAGPGGYRRAALAHISRHVSDPHLSVAQVARAVGISERHLSRVFRHDGVGVAKRIHELRMARARDLLVKDDALSVREVAALCGFTSHAAFSRAFKDRHGFPPTDARRPLRKTAPISE
jgi:AraC-like DNA-binding protein